MPIALERRPIAVDVDDADAVRGWLKDRVAEEVRTTGQPRPRAVFLFDDREETLDFTSMGQHDPGASPGATFQRLKRPGVVRQFVLLRIDGEGDAGEPHVFALLLEEIDEPDAPRRWWVSMIEYRQDPATGAGQLLGPWKDSPYETTRVSDLWPALRELAEPPVGARPARVLPARRPRRDLYWLEGMLPTGAPEPATARQLAKLASVLAAKPLLDGTARGTVVFRLAGLAWEVFLLTGIPRDDLDELVRAIAQRDPPATAVALAALVIDERDDPPEPFLQIVAELGGRVVEYHARLAFPEGPAGPKVPTAERWRPEHPVPEVGLWVGVEPVFAIDLFPITVGDA